MMRPPFMARVAAGVALTVAEEARQLPSTAVALPMSSVSMVLQTSMRIQQTMTSLAIKGDEVFAFLYPESEQPEWAVFDEDEAPSAGEGASGASGVRSGITSGAGASGARGSSKAGVRPSGPGRFALYSTPNAATRGRVGASSAKAVPADAAAPEIAGLIDYDTLTLAQLRPRLRSLSADDLSALLAYERATAGRAPFLTMLENRLASASAT